VKKRDGCQTKHSRDNRKKGHMSCFGHVLVVRIGEESIKGSNLRLKNDKIKLEFKKINCM